jgi:hypothetical protein
MDAIDSKMAETRLRLESVGGLDSFDRDHARRLAFIAALPPADDASDLECRAVFYEVMRGVLECTYGDSDGRHTMSEYVQAALGPAGHSVLSEDQKASLSGSRLWPYLSFNRDRS